MKRAASGPLVTAPTQAAAFFQSGQQPNPYGRTSCLYGYGYPPGSFYDEFYKNGKIKGK